MVLVATWSLFSCIIIRGNYQTHYPIWGMPHLLLVIYVHDFMVHHSKVANYTKLVFFFFCNVFVMQVWGWDLENNIDILLIDADYMVLVNDPKLKEFINHLESSIDTGSIAVKRIIKYLIDFAGVAMLKLLEIMIEVVL